MHYRLRDKRRRNEAIRQYKKDNPDITLREMASVFGVSYQRIYQILKSHDKANAS